MGRKAKRKVINSESLVKGHTIENLKEKVEDVEKNRDKYVKEDTLGFRMRAIQNILTNILAKKHLESGGNSIINLRSGENGANATLVILGPKDVFVNKHIKVDKTGLYTVLYLNGDLVHQNELEHKGAIAFCNKMYEMSIGRNGMKNGLLFGEELFDLQERIHNLNIFGVTIIKEAFENELNK